MPDGPGIVTGEAPATPIQHWFLDAITAHREHWNQSYLLEVAPSLSGDAVEAAVRALLAHHDALRLRLVERDGEWRQVFAATLLVFGLATGAAALAWSVGALLVFRFLIGLGLGAELPVASTLVSEFAPARVRGRRSCGACWWRGLREDHAEERRREHALRKRLRAIVDPAVSESSSASPCPSCGWAAACSRCWSWRCCRTSLSVMRNDCSSPWARPAR